VDVFLALVLDYLGDNHFPNRKFKKMRTIKIIALLLAFVTTTALAQNTKKGSDQTKTIEINNDNGELSITFVNGVISEFEVNDKPVAKERYDDYQSIIDDFAEEAHPTPPEPPATVSNESDELKKALSEYLMNEGHINSFMNYKVDLKRKFLKVDGKKMSKEVHQACLTIFEEIYGRELNKKSRVKFKKSKGNFSSSISLLY